MQFSLETGEGLKRRITITVPAADFDKQVTRRLQQIGKKVRLDGFRPGKVPLKVVKRRYGSDARQEILGEVLQKSFVDAINESNINPAGAPTLESTTNEEGKDLEFVASFEVYPEIILAEFSDFNIESPEADVQDKDIDAMIEKLREQHKGWLLVEDENVVAEKGDKILIDYEGKTDGETFEGGSAENTELELGSNQMIPGFEDGLTGIKAGETRTLNLTFPDHYYENLKGKDVEFTVTTKEIYKPETPEVDDEFIAKFGVTEGGIEKFREEIKGNMGRELKKAIRHKVKNQVWDQLLKGHDFDTPIALINQEADQMLDQFISRLQRETGYEGKLDKSKISTEPFMKEARKRVRLGLIVAEFISKNEIKPSEDEVRDMLNEIASPYEDPQSVIDWYYNNPKQLNKIEYAVLEEKVVDKILDVANITKKVCDYDEAVKISEPEDDSEIEEDAGDRSEAGSLESSPESVADEGKGNISTDEERNSEENMIETGKG